MISFLAQQDSLAVAVADTRVTLTRGGSSRTVDRARVAAVFVDGKQLVLQGESAEDLARETSDLAAPALERALRAHRYPWHADGDPYREEFQRWVDGMPDLPGNANALLKAREHALRKGNDHDSAELRTEVNKLGVVVRDERKRQYWRRTHQ